jgi:magnesium transporter
MSEELAQELDFKQQFEEVRAINDRLAMTAFLNDQNISEIAEMLDDHPDYESDVMNCMDLHRSAMVFKILDVPAQKRIMNLLSSYRAAELLNELPADDRVAFLEELPTSVVRDLIKTLGTEERIETLQMLGYKENSVGRLMVPDYVYIYANSTVKEVLDLVRTVGKDSETIDVLYVINKQGELLDDIRIREFLLAPLDKKVEELMDERVISLHVNDDQEVANQVFKMNNRTALPVVDDNNILLGIVTIDDVLWVANEEFSEDIQKIGGSEALDAPYLETPILQLFKKRVGWLIILFLGEMITASVMQYFEAELAKAIVLAMFIPLIISSGGNSGSQASTLVIQAMAVGELTIADWWRVMRRELLSGLMLGLVLGVVGFFRVVMWQQVAHIYGEYYIRIGITVGITLLGIVMWGTFTGSMLPLLLKKLGADPAVSSAPFVATLVDVTGLIIYFGVAYLLLSGLML